MASAIDSTAAVPGGVVVGAVMDSRTLFLGCQRIASVPVTEVIVVGAHHDPWLVGRRVRGVRGEIGDDVARGLPLADH